MSFSLGDNLIFLKKKKYFFTALFFVITVLLIAIIVGQEGWGERSEKRIGITKNFCEMNHEGLIRQPMNTLSSFALCIPGFYILWKWEDQEPTQTVHYEQGQSPLKYQSIESALFAITCILVGLGAAAAHGTQSKEGSTLDVLAMVLWILFPIIFNISRMRKYDSISFFTIWSIVSLLGILILKTDIFLSKIGVANFYMFAIPLWIIIEIVAVKSKLRESNKWLMFGTLSFTTGYLTWLYDQTEAGCNAYSLFQWHAVWHILCAVSMYSFWLHLRMENADQKL